MSNENVIYDDRIPRITQQPKKRKSNRLFIFLVLLFCIVIILILYFQSDYSKLSEVNFSGNAIVTDERLLKQARLELGMSYINIRNSEVKDWLEQMVEIDEIKVTRIFPNKVKIEIQEFPIVSYWLEDNQLYPILSSGQILLNRPWINKRVDRPILSGWKHKEGLPELSKELERLPLSISGRISEITSTPIPSDPYRLTLYMEDGNEVRTSIRKFAENMNWYPDLVEQAEMEGYQDKIFNLLDAKWFEDPTQIRKTLENKESEDMEGDS
jgi:cell division protein FtsQ